MSDIEIQRHDNGIRVRADGKGDPWADEHRQALNNCRYTDGRKMCFPMTDIDGIRALIGNNQEFETLTIDGEDRLFDEYTTDPAVGHVVIFDRKSSMSSLAYANPAQEPVLVDLCLKIGRWQHPPPMFAYIIGNQPPWTVLVVDLHTRQRTKFVCHGADWSDVWDLAGFVRRREEIERFLKR